MASPARALAGALSVLVLAAAVRAQGGWTTEKFPEFGLSFPRARTYEVLPIQPSEDLIVLSFAEKVPENPKERRRTRPELDFVWIEHAPLREAQTGSEPGAPAAGGEGAGETKEQPRQKPIDTLERFAEERLKGWKLGTAKPGKEREGCTVREFTPTLAKSDGRALWLFSYEGKQRTIALLGICDDKDLAEAQKIWRYTAEHLDIGPPEGQDRSKVEQFYARKAFKAVDYRVKVRMDMVRGWKAEDTENYLVLYDTPDQPLVRKIIRDLELLRKEYEKLFPPEKPVESVSAVRICKSRDEYFSYGGPPRSAGYWNWHDEELVLYDAETVDKAHHVSDANTFIALYHEAFHQYIHYSTGELPPHSWFNEGTGDYFSGATIKDGKVRSIGVNWWRLKTIQKAIAENKYVPFGEIIKYEQPEYYRQDIVHICYAEGWSMIYFLRKSELVAKRAEWARILPTYFDVLKSSYAEELAALEAAGKSKNGEARGKAGLAARTKALDKAFEGVDLAELEGAWKTFVSALVEPKHD